MAPPRTETVSLVEPIVRGETTIPSITIRKPRGGELRDLNLQDVAASNVAALLKVIPRISNPPLTDDEADMLDPADLMEIGGIIRGFFMTAAERQAIAMLIAEHQPKS
ncbi:phage tail assembly protein [Novosphingobium colocasiae]